MEKLVSFRDGQAAHRVTQYIAWLVDALERGLTREEALAYAKERYSQVWGLDLTAEIAQPFLEMAS